MEVRWLVVDGAAIDYRVAGEGEPVVLIHGLSGSWRRWSAVLEPLAERHCVYLPDLPRLGRQLPAAELTGWLGRWLDAAALERVDLVGHSLGVGPRGFGGTLSEARRVRGVDSFDWPCGQDSG